MRVNSGDAGASPNLSARGQGYVQRIRGPRMLDYPYVVRSFCCLLSAALFGIVFNVKNVLLALMSGRGTSGRSICFPVPDMYPHREIMCETMCDIMCEIM